MSALKLPVEIKTRWLTWLRDPTSRQTNNTLVNDGAYCCLGGLGLVCGLEDAQMAGYGGLLNYASQQSNVIPGVVLAVLEQPTLTGTLRSHGEGYTNVQGDLITMNDFRGKTFLEIADWVEENL